MKYHIKEDDMMAASSDPFRIRPATEADVPLIFSLIKELAEYERLCHTVTATETLLRKSLFGGERRTAEVVIGEYRNIPVCFALFFQNYSTFMGKPGLYLEDLYVREAYRGRGFGKKMLRYLAAVATDRDYGRFEWSVLDWNEPAIQFYKRLGAIPLDDWTVFRLTGEVLDNLAAEDKQKNKQFP